RRLPCPRDLGAECADRRYGAPPRAMLGRSGGGIDRIPGSRRARLGPAGQPHRRTALPGANFHDDTTARAAAGQFVEQVSFMVRQPAVDPRRESLDTPPSIQCRTSFTATTPATPCANPADTEST